MPGHGMHVWSELNSRNIEAAKKFYGDTLGWQFDAMPMGEEGTYWIAKSNGEMAAGLFQMSGPEFEGVPEHWLHYIETDNIDDRIALARKAGAEIIRDPFDIPGIGKIAILKDPNGAAMGWMTSASSS